MYPPLIDELFRQSLRQLDIFAQDRSYSSWVLFRFIRTAYIDTLRVPIQIKIVQDYEYIMAKEFQWNNVRIPLAKTHKKKVLEFAESFDNDVQGLFDILIDDNLKMSCTFSEKQSSWIITFTRNDTHKLQPKSSISSWSNDPLEAMWMTLYKHIVICSRDVWEATEDDEAWG